MMRTSRWPAYGRFGLALVAVAWGLNWSLRGLRTHLLFFPLWLGYCLVVDAWVLARTGSSLLARGRARFAGLFLLSAPAWWLFEAINARTRNWIYLGREAFSAPEYFLLASIAFSTVMPAVFETAELVRSLLRSRRAAAARGAGADGCAGAAVAAAPHRRAIGPAGTARTSARPPAWLLPVGVIALAALLAWPETFFPFVWLSVWLVLEPVNGLLGHRTLWSEPRGRGRRTAFALMLGALVCGLFWELWNWRSYPKWIYRIAYLQEPHLFEMPLAGYGGYLPFALELFALYQLAAGLVDRCRRHRPAAAHAAGLDRPGRLAEYVLPPA